MGRQWYYGHRHSNRTKLSSVMSQTFKIDYRGCLRVVSSERNSPKYRFPHVQHQRDQLTSRTDLGCPKPTHKGLYGHHRSVYSSAMNHFLEHVRRYSKHLKSHSDVVHPELDVSSVL